MQANFQPTEAPLTADQESKITELHARSLRPLEEQGKLPAAYARGNDQDKKIYLYKFLIAQKWDVNDAAEMLENTAAWREKYELDKKPNFPAAFPVRGFNAGETAAFLGRGERPTNQQIDATYASIAKAYAVAWHKTTKYGHPVKIERTGMTNAKGFYKGVKAVTPPATDMVDVMGELHAHINEVGAGLVAVQNHKSQTGGIPTNNQGVYGTMVVMDCQGLSFGTMYRPSLKLLQNSFTIDTKFYPEYFCATYLVNAPQMINFAFNVVKGWLAPRVQAHVQIVTAEQTTARLLEVINAEDLPDFLGGKCSCEGGCCPVNEENLSPSSPAGAEDCTQTEEVQVGAGKNETRKLELEKGESLSWEYRIPEKNAIFSVTFTPTGQDEAETVVSPVKGNEGCGSYTANDSAGTVTLVWDNSYSWMHGKTVSLRVLKI